MRTGPRAGCPGPDERAAAPEDESRSAMAPDRRAVSQFAGTEEPPPHPGREHQGQDRDQQNQCLPVLEQSKRAPGSVNHHVVIPQWLQPSPALVRPWLLMETLSFTRFISPVPAPCGSMIRVRPSPVPILEAKTVGARQLVRQDGGRVAHFTVRNRCNPPRRAHQLSSGYPSRLLACSRRVRSTSQTASAWTSPKRSSS